MADKEKYTLKIMIEPKNSPCEFCKGCSWFERCESTCEKLAAFNNKIICQEYDYDKAIEVMAKEMARRELAKMQPRFNPTKEEYESIWAYEVLPNTQKRFRDQAEAALNALLEGVKR